MKNWTKLMTSLAIVFAMVGNTFATFGTAQASTYSGDFIEEISTEELVRLIEERQNPSFKPNEPVFLKLKKDKLSEAVEKAIEEAKFETKTARSNRAKLYGTIVDEKSGVVIELHKNDRAEIERLSPLSIARANPEGFIDAEFRRIESEKAKQRFSHFSALRNATRQAAGPYGLHFGIEALTFYTGVGANHLFNLMTKYEKNPMALELFLEELQDPIAQAGFFAFMVGNRYAQTIFQTMLATSNSPRLKAMAGPFLGFLAMGVGSVFSNITHDLITLTKPCADALYNTQKPEYNSPEKRAEKCMEGWNAVMTSDNLFRYVTSVITVVGAAAGSSFVQMAYKGVGRRILPLYGVTALMKKAVRPKNLAKGKVVPGPVGLGLRIFDLVLFLQADELLHPVVHKAIESTVNSSRKLSVSRQGVNLLISALDQSRWTDTTQQMCKNAAQNLRYSTKDHLPLHVENDLKVCGEGLSSLIDIAEKNKKWRETITYDFMNSYMNWMRYISEFQVMHDVSRDFFDQLINYSYFMKEDPKNESMAYNPLAKANYFYGVVPTEGFQDTGDHRDLERARAQRLVDAIPVIDKSISDINAFTRRWNATNKTNQSSKLVEGLTEAKRLISVYAREKTPRNYVHLVNAIIKINELHKQFYTDIIASSRSHRPAPVSPYASRGEAKASVYPELEKSMAKKEISDIRKFIGDPRPLPSKVAFVQMFNDQLKEEKGEYLELFEEKGTPTDTLIWYAACGNNLDSESTRVDRRRAGFATYFDSGVNKIFGALNKATDWLAKKTHNINDLRLRENVSPLLNTFKAIKYGTGVDFYVPRIVKDDLTQVCKNPLTPIRPSKNKNNHFKVNGVSYDSLFTYLINNIDPKVLNLSEQLGGFQYPNFLAWWEEEVTPRVAVAYETFSKDYSVLLRKTYREAIDSERGRGDPSLKGLAAAVKAPRSKPRSLPANLVQSYVEEMNLYLKILNRAYVMTPEIQNYTSQKTKQDIALFNNKLKNLKTILYGLLNDLRTIDTRGEGMVITSQKGNTSVPRVSGHNSTDIREKYALALLEMRSIFAALGFGNEAVDTAAVITPFFKKRDGVETVPPMVRLQMRVENDPTISEPFYQYVENMTFENEPLPLTYGLTERNFKVIRDGVRLNPEVQGFELVNFKRNDALTTAFIAANQLFGMAEDLFMSANILEAASMGATNYDIDFDENAPKGTGSRPF